MLPDTGVQFRACGKAAASIEVCTITFVVCTITFVVCIKSMTFEGPRDSRMYRMRHSSMHSNRHSSMYSSRCRSLSSSRCGCRYGSTYSIRPLRVGLCRRDTFSVAALVERLHLLSDTLFHGSPRGRFTASLFLHFYTPAVEWEYGSARMVQQGPPSKA